MVRALRQECGAILVFTAVAIPTLLALIGFGFDVGNLYMHKARLQNVADAAALAGARAYIDYLDTTEGGKISGGDTKDKPVHANEAAEDYVAKNSINLPNAIYHDFNSKKVRESDASNTLYPNKTFYRIGLYENVNLYFLPVISGIPKTQKVRAEAIAIAIKGTTTEEESQEPQDPQPLNRTGYSVFQNLFTYSNSLDLGKTAYIEYQGGVLTGSSHIKAGYDGNIVYTFQNGDSSKIDTNQPSFFDDTRIGIEKNDQDSNNLEHYYRHNGYFSNSDVKNDPTINMRNGTEDYIEAFQEKLAGPHVNVTNQNLTVQAISDSAINSIYKIANQDTLYSLIGNDYYPLDSTGYNPIYAKDSTNKVTKNMICYHQFPNQNEYVRCIKTVNNKKATYYLLNSQDQITDKYLTSEPNPNWWPPTIDTSSITFQDYKSSADFPSAVSNFQQQSFGSGLKEDVYYAYSIGSNTLTISVDSLNATGNRTKDDPVYLIVDGTNISTVKFQNYVQDSDTSREDVGGNVRPVVLVFFGTGEVIMENSGDRTQLNAMIYAPLADFHTGYQGTFRGSVVAKNIKMPYGGNGGDSRGKWYQKNFLENDNDIKAVTDSIIQPEMNNDIRTQVKNIWKNTNLTLNGSKITAENIGDKDWYNNLPFSDKRLLYQKFVELVKVYPKLKKVLWAWDGAFNQDVPPPPNPQDPTVSVTTTPDNIRLINPRVERNPFTIYNVQWKML